MAGGPPEMPRPPYEDEGILGPGGRKFIAALLALAVAAGLVVAALNVDFGGAADDDEESSASESSARESSAGEEHADNPSESWSGPGSSPGNPSPDRDAKSAPAALSTGGLKNAMSALREEVGPNPMLLRVLAARDGIELDVRGANRPVGYRWSGGELTELEFVVVVGPKDSAFSASLVDPGSLGRLLEGAKRHDRGRKLEVINATLSPDLIEGKLAWVLNEEAPNGANLTFRARPSGRAVQQIGGSGAPGTGLPPTTQRQLRDAQRRTDCFEEAGTDTEATIDCANRSSP